MATDYVLNELSFRGAAAQAGQLTRLLAQLVELALLPGKSTVVYGCASLDDPSTPEGNGYAQCKQIVNVLPPNDPSRLRVLGFFTRRGSFVPDLALDTRHGGQPAVGLGYALELGTVALSLDLTPWQSPWITLLRERFRGQSLVSDSADVRHASESQHFQVHKEWVEQLADVDKLRVLRTLFGFVQTPASEYSRGKHVRGVRDTERQENAAKPAGAGQYRAVSDDEIAAWERDAFAAVVEGGSTSRGRVERRGPEQYNLYYCFDHPIGYASGGAETTCVRVEWSHGKVHSHPRPESDLRSRK